MIHQLWIYPPLAFARVGPSLTPCDNFHWGPNDLRPRGTGKTTIQAMETLHVAADGTISSSMPTEITFKDAAGLKPVCPFFELHGEWSVNGEVHSGPITPQVLDTFGLAAHDLTWSVEVANLKPFHYTLMPDDRIVARVELPSDRTERQQLAGTSPDEAQRPLVPLGQSLPLGSVQLTRPSNAFPGFRLRFTPGAGWVYGPTNLPERGTDIVLPQERLILNTEASWCHFELSSDDVRTNPSNLYAVEELPSGRLISLGLVDDVCDGLISCMIKGVPPAFARIVVGPPQYAPDRRTFTSLADGLTDRVRRNDVRDPAYTENMALTSAEVGDLMERILETMELMNLDYQNQRARSENSTVAADQGLPPALSAGKAFPAMEPILERPLPLTEYGRQKHRRFVSLEVFEDMLRERPDLINKIIREPMTGDRYYDQRMPALMRGSDRYPMHITRRQYDLLIAWMRRLRQDVEEVS